MIGRPRPSPRRLAALILTLGLAGIPLGGCGGSHHSDSSSHRSDFDQDQRRDVDSLSPLTCASVSLDTLQQVAERIYSEAANGRVLAQALRRLQRSPALAAAIKGGDRALTRRVLRGLFESQIVRVRLTHDGRVLADIGKRSAIAPATAPLRDGGGREIASATVSVAGANGLAQTIGGLLGTQVLVLSGRQLLAGTIRMRGISSGLLRGGHLRLHGTSYRVRSFSARTFDGAPLRVTLLAAASTLHRCGETPAETVADTLGAVGMRIYADERSGRRVAAVVRHVERSRIFRGAVLSGSASATRAAIVGFFKTHLHVVRVRATLGAHLVADLGGPYALAPVAGSVRAHGGRVLGHFLLAVQDDMGYMLLAHQFTGAQVLMRVAGRQVMGTLWPGPASVPDRGPVSYGGVSYEAFSFTGQAFPSGTVRISLLAPAG